MRRPLTLALVAFALTTLGACGGDEGSESTVPKGRLGAAETTPRAGTYMGSTERGIDVDLTYRNGEIMVLLVDNRAVVRSMPVGPGRAFTATAPDGTRYAGRWTSPTEVTGTIVPAGGGADATWKVEHFTG